MNTRNFYAGEEFFAHLMLGAHLVEEGVRFRTFAPAASKIELLLEDERIPMAKVADGNFWEATVPGAKADQAYEYRIWHGGSFVDHADPYAYRAKLRPAHRSVVADLSYEWHDGEWMAARTDCREAPMNVYELHLGSWRKRSGDEPSDDPADWYSYDELADMLPGYVKKLGATHVEFLPLNEHPFDGSWGYEFEFKGNGSRVLYLPDRAAEHMRRYVEEFHGAGAEPGRYLFWSRNHPEGTAPLSQDAVTKLLRRHAATAAATCRDVPLDITPHRLRHARATHWLDRGMRLAQVSLMLGHASVQTTMDYLDVSVEAKSEAMQSMADAPGPRCWKAARAMSLLERCGLA